MLAPSLSLHFPVPIKDAINKGMQYLQRYECKVLESAVSPDGPLRHRPPVRADYPHKQPVRQRRRGFIMENIFGFKLPKAMHAEFGALIQQREQRKNLG